MSLMDPNEEVIQWLATSMERSSRRMDVWSNIVTLMVVSQRKSWLQLNPSHDASHTVVTPEAAVDGESTTSFTNRG
jgi:hypothetical protein